MAGNGLVMDSMAFMAIAPDPGLDAGDPAHRQTPLVDVLSHDGPASLVFAFAQVGEVALRFCR